MVHIICKGFIAYFLLVGMFLKGRPKIQKTCVANYL